jgi:hypothetical protein
VRGPWTVVDRVVTLAGVATKPREWPGLAAVGRTARAAPPTHALMPGAVHALRQALERADDARALLARARQDEEEALRDLRSSGLTWWEIAAKVAPLRQRNCLARLLRQRYSQRRRVAGCDRKAPSILGLGRVSSGGDAGLRTSSVGKEVDMPAAEKVLKRITVRTTEFLDADRLDAADDDSDDDDPGEEEELDEGDVRPKGKSKRTKG